MRFWFGFKKTWLTNHELTLYLQAKNDTLKWVDYIAMSYIMVFDINEVNSSYNDEFNKVENDRKRFFSFRRMTERKYCLFQCTSWIHLAKIAKIWQREVAKKVPKYRILPFWPKHWNVKGIRSFSTKKHIATMAVFNPLMALTTITIDTINANAADMLKKGEQCCTEAGVCRFRHNWILGLSYSLRPKTNIRSNS